MTTASPEFSRRGFVAALLALGVAKALPLPMGLGDIVLPLADDWPLTSQYTLTFIGPLVPVDDVARAA